MWKFNLHGLIISGLIVLMFVPVYFIFQSLPTSFFNEQKYFLLIFMGLAIPFCSTVLHFLPSHLKITLSAPFYLFVAPFIVSVSFLGTFADLSALFIAILFFMLLSNTLKVNSSLLKSFSSNDRVILLFVLMWLVPSLMNYTDTFVQFTFLIFIIFSLLTLAGRSNLAALKKNVVATFFTPTEYNSFEKTTLILVSLVFGIICSIPDDGSDSIAAYLGHFSELIELGGNIKDPLISTIGLVPLPGLWFNSFVGWIAGGSVSALKVSNGFIILFSVWFLTQALGNNRQNSVLIALFVISSPVLWKVIHGNFPDAHALSASVILLIVLQSWFSHEKISSAHSLFYGIAFGTIILVKYLLVPLVLVTGLIMTVAEIYRHGKSGGLNIGIALLGMITTISLYIGYVYLLTGNPLFPFYNQFFQSEWYPSVNIITAHTGYLTWTLFWDISVHTPTYTEVSSFIGNLGIISWVGFLASLYVIVAGIWRKNIFSVETISSVVFIFSIIWLSILQNNDRYIFPYFIWAYPALMQVVITAGKRTGQILAIALLGSNFLFAGQIGYGAGSLSLRKVISQQTFIQNWEYDRQKLRIYFDAQQDPKRTNFLVLGQKGNLVGNVYQNNWYSSHSALKINQEILGNGIGWDKFLNGLNIDHVIIQAGKFISSTEQLDGLLLFLNEAAINTASFGEYMIWTIDDNISADTVEPAVVASLKSGGMKIIIPGEHDDIWAKLNISCRGVGNLLTVHVGPGGWTNPNNRSQLCNGKEQEIHIPIHHTAGKQLLVDFRDFKDFKYHGGSVFRRKRVQY